MRSKRKLFTSITAISLVAIIIFGTLAWTNFGASVISSWYGRGNGSESDSNLESGDDSDLGSGSDSDLGSGGTLHNNHDSNSPHKQVFVENWGSEDLFVRIRLDEFMETGEGAGLKSTSLDDDGKPIHNPLNRARPLEAGMDINDVATWITHKPVSGDEGEEKPEECQTEADFHKYWRWGMGGQSYYLPALRELRADKAYVSNNGSATITEDSINFDGERARKTLPAQVLTMVQWQLDGKSVGDYWVVDRDGWAYWASPLRPGTATGLLLNSVTLISVPEEDYYYGININAQMATKNGEVVGGVEDNYLRFGDQNNGGWTQDGQDLMNLIVSYDSQEIHTSEFFDPETGASALITATDCAFENVIIRVSDNEELARKYESVLASEIHEFITSAPIESARITLPVKSELLGEANLNEFAIFWYNKAEQAFEILDNQYIDLEGQTISADTSHFSLFAILHVRNWQTTFSAPLNGLRFQVNENAQGIAAYADVVFVVDESNSMENMRDPGENNDPERFRVQAAKSFADALIEGDRSAVVGFSASARTHLRLTTDMGLVHDALDNITGNRNGTALFRGLDQAVDMLLQQSSSNRLKAIIALTDGVDFPSVPLSFYDNIISRARENGIVIYTIGLGHDVSHENLRYIAVSTGGEYHHIVNASDLPDAYQRIAEIINGGMENDDSEDVEINRDEDTLINRVRVMRAEREAIKRSVVFGLDSMHRTGLDSVNRTSNGELELSGLVLPAEIYAAKRVVHLPAIDIIQNLIDYGYPDDWLFDTRGARAQDWVAHVIERDRNPAANKGIFDPESFYGWFDETDDNMVFLAVQALRRYLGIDLHAEFEQYQIARSYDESRQYPELDFDSFVRTCWQFWYLDFELQHPTAVRNQERLDNIASTLNTVATFVTIAHTGYSIINYLGQVVHTYTGNLQNGLNIVKNMESGNAVYRFAGTGGTAGKGVNLWVWVGKAEVLTGSLNIAAMEVIAIPISSLSIGQLEMVLYSISHGSGGGGGGGGGGNPPTPTPPGGQGNTGEGSGSGGTGGSEGSGFPTSSPVEVSGRRPIDRGHSYEVAVRDGFYSNARKESFTVIIDGQTVRGEADAVTTIAGKRTAIEAKYVHDWSTSLRNPANTMPWALNEQQRMIDQAIKYSAAFPGGVIYHTNSIELATHYSKVFNEAGIANFRFIITPIL